MSSILYIGKDYCRTLEQLQGYFLQISSDQDSLYNEILTLQRDGLIAQWLEEGSEAEKSLAKRIRDLSMELTNKELMEKLAEILTKQNTSYQVNLFSYVELKEVTYALLEKSSIEATYVKIGKGDTLEIDEKSLLEKLKLKLNFKVVKPEIETFRLKASLSLKGRKLHESTTDLCLNNKSASEEMFSSFEIPTKVLEKSSDTYLLEIRNESQTLFSVKLSLGVPGTFTVNGVQFKMIKVDGGSFQSSLRHKVTLSEYYIGETVVTQALWQAVMNNNPSNFKGDELPVENVSYNDIKPFLDKLNAHLRVQLQGRKFALPTEEQWEFAARGGTKSKGFKYSGSNDLNEVAWYKYNSVNRTHTVKTKRPNELGIYDMSGNVWEWCESNAIRGGSWFGVATSCCVVNRICYTSCDCGSHLGFRLVLQ